MARLASALAGLLLCAALPTAAGAQARIQAGAQAGAGQAIFVDRSGSMRPYFESGLIGSIVRPLDLAANAHGGVTEFAFSTDVSRVRSLEQINTMPFGEFTYLDKVIDACERQHTPIGWIVTDNIEDTGAAGNTERFYRKLRGDEVRRVTVFPVLAQPGRPGLVVYALLFDSAANDLYDGMLAGFAEAGKGVIRTNPLRMKPVDRDTIEVTSRSLAPLTRRGGPKVYEAGAPIRDSVEVRFKSKFDHIQIVDSALRVLGAAPAFQPDSLLVPERREVHLTPDRIRSLGPGDETTQVYLLTVDLGKLQLKSSPAAWWKAAWGKPGEEAQLDLKFQIEVPQQNFRLSPRFLNEFSAPTIEGARATGKVYAIDRLLSNVNGGNTRIEVDSPLYFKVNYPAWPAVLWIMLFVGAVAVALGMVVFGRRLLPTRTRHWSVRAEAAGGYALDARIDGDRVLVEGENIARIEKNHLLPVHPTRLEGGAIRVPLAPGTRVHATTRRNDMDLVFDESREQAQAAARPAGSAPAPAPTASAPTTSAPTPTTSAPTTSAPPRRR